MKEKTNVKKKTLNNKSIANKEKNVNMYFYQHGGRVFGKIAQFNTYGVNQSSSLIGDINKQQMKLIP